MAKSVVPPFDNKSKNKNKKKNKDKKKSKIVEVDLNNLEN